MFPNKFSRIDRLAEQKNTAALLSMMYDPRESVRLAIIHALGHCPDDEAFSALSSLLRAPESAVRRAAVLALTDMNRPGCRECIVRQMALEMDRRVLGVMQASLARMK